ncbi:hypothetical protein J8273_8659 [Carpediemonas membranifera]|uniref:Uncharacterized protein n=1 Tax=Carpediemonas membranifera TaxID=201153 RepID=A0A8J6API2_9EUKA|nr:hypothetical protein J8273_8659 [Carpediemonas membranifera]|eukprot:KAG9389971.1 hypothetical protein J8273_8659 [Carpediemonas membranifera]
MIRSDLRAGSRILAEKNEKETEDEPKALNFQTEDKKEPTEPEEEEEEEEEDPLLAMEYIDSMVDLPSKRALNEEARWIRRIHALIQSSKMEPTARKRLNHEIFCRRKALNMKDDNWSDATSRKIRNEEEIDELFFKAKEKGHKKEEDDYFRPRHGRGKKDRGSRGSNNQ